jgi:hypothetical protein
MSFHQMAHLGNRPFAALAAGAVAVVVGAQPAVLIGLVLTPLGLLATRRAWSALSRPPAESRGSALPAVELGVDQPIVDPLG